MVESEIGKNIQRKWKSRKELEITTKACGTIYCRYDTTLK